MELDDSLALHSGEAPPASPDSLNPSRSGLEAASTAAVAAAALLAACGGGGSSTDTPAPVVAAPSPSPPTLASTPARSGAGWVRMRRWSIRSSRAW